jgi:WD40 repeat protein
MILMGH